MSKKYLVVLKTPGASFMVDGIVEKFPRYYKSMDFMQEGKMLSIPIHTDSNIAYIMEMSEEDVDAFEEQIARVKDQVANAKSKLVKPKFLSPSGKLN